VLDIAQITSLIREHWGFRPRLKINQLEKLWMAAASQQSGVCELILVALS
jgi:hypothetical protein